MSFVVGKGRRSKSVLTIPEWASAACLWGRLRANNRRGDGERKVGHTGAWERTLSITIL
jgi:hypothetical protein